MPEAQAPSKAAPPPVLYEFKNPDELSKALASFVLAAQDEALKKQNTFKIAISGGSLPKVLGQDLFGRDGVKWDKWSVKSGTLVGTSSGPRYRSGRGSLFNAAAATDARSSLYNYFNPIREVFFADERLVPLDHEDSNFRANDEELFSKVPIPRENIHVIDTNHLDDPEHVADEYEKQMIKTFVEGSNSIAFPRFDLILLGIGPDGHTCSLFPGHELLEEVDGWVAYLVDSPKPPASRITLTFPVLNHAHRVAFVASGAGKQDILHRALDKPEEGLPCSRVKVKNPGQVYWFSDEAALKEVSYNRTPFESAKL